MHGKAKLIVTDVETEPSGDLWIVLDVNRAVQSGKAESDTLETGVVLAASAAAEFLGGGERRSVGLLAATAADPFPEHTSNENSGDNQEMLEPGLNGSGSGAQYELGKQDRVSSRSTHLVDVPPQPGKGQVWRILAALAPVQAGDLSLAQLLRRSRGLFSAGQTVLVITSDIGEGVQDWTAELLHLRSGGVSASVLAVNAGCFGRIERRPSQRTRNRHRIPRCPDRDPASGALYRPGDIETCQRHRGSTSKLDRRAYKARNPNPIPASRDDTGAGSDLSPHSHDIAHDPQRRRRCPRG